MVLPLGAILGIGGSLLGSFVQSSAARRATNAQVEASNRQMELFERMYGDQRRAFRPFQQLGRNALRQYSEELGQGFQEGPGYQFAIDQGQQAIDNSAASRGQLFSGATLKAQQAFGQGMANQEYGNYLNRLSGLAGMGQAAAGNQAAAAGNFGAMSANALGSMGNAQSAGAMAQGNAFNTGLENALSVYGMYS